jgi:hypothetical protein
MPSFDRSYMNIHAVRWIPLIINKHRADATIELVDERREIAPIHAGVLIWQMVENPLRCPALFVPDDSPRQRTAPG